MDTNTATAISQSIASGGFPNQSRGSSIKPKSTKMRFRIPEYGSSIHLNIVEVITTEAAQGIITIQRTTVRPKKRAFNN